MSKQSYRYRNLSVDLGSKYAKPALEALLKMEKRRHKVRSATIFSKSGYIRANMEEILELLNRLPNLKQLTVDLHHFLPLQTLGSLSECPRLKELRLQHLQLQWWTSSSGGQDTPSVATANPTNFTAQAKGMQLLPASLQELTLLHCRGGPALETLFQTGLPSSPSIKKLTISNTSLGTTPEDMNITMAKLASNPHLQSLKLQDIPSLTDRHVQTLTSSNTCNPLQELEVTSNILGAPAGETILHSLNTPSSTLFRLEHLKLHLDWEFCGSTVAAVLPTNHRLKQLDLRLYGDDDKIRGNAILIAQALQKGTSALKRLRLCMEMEPDLEEDQAVLDAFQETLKTNLTLQHLELDDCLDAFPLPLELETALRLNRSGAPKLFKRQQQAPHEQFVQALAYQRDDLTTLFHILRQEPTLCCTAATETMEVDVDSEEDSSSLEQDELLIKPNALPKTTNTQKRTKTKRFFQRHVRSIFATAPSA